MKWEEFIKITGNLPVVETQVLLAGVSDPKPLKVQISRWHKGGKLIQVKRGVYLLDMPYRKMVIFEPYLASILKKPSYLSLEKALEYHSLIPEAVSVYTSVTPKRPGRFASEAGTFDYRHIRNSLFWGYDSITVHKQTAFVASPEKALLDFFYLKGTGVSFGYLSELRLQNMGKVRPDKLMEYARKFKKPGMLRVARLINKYIRVYKEEEKLL